jgi:aminopeptidase
VIAPIVERFATLLTGYCTGVGVGDQVYLAVDTPALDLGRALTRSVLAAGAQPHLRLAYPELHADLVELTGDAVLDAPPTLELEEMRRMDAYIRVDAPSNSRGLQQADKRRIARLHARNRPVVERRTNHTRWVSTLYPTASGAQDAGMSLDAFEAFVLGAMFLDEDDPVRRWTELRTRQDRLIARLSQADEVRIEADGTDVRMSVAGRSWMNSDGRRNMPSGEVFTGPLEGSAEGIITFDVPSSVQGVLVEGARLTFQGGRVVDASARRGEDMLLAQLDTDDGARRLGELGIGTNERIQRAILRTLFDEKIGGTVHLALGRSYPETGGVNESAIHWDLVCDLRHGGRLSLDGEPFQVDGRFLL